MTLHLIKLCVGCDSIQDLEDWIKQRLREKRKRGEKAEHIHRTRMMPKRADELTDGAVDVAWFRSAYERLGAANWKKVDAAAKFACAGSGHARARLFADAMLGNVSSQETSSWAARRSSLMLWA